MRIADKTALSIANLSTGKGAVTPDDVKVAIQSNPAKLNALVAFLDAARSKKATWSRPQVTKVEATKQPDVFAALVYIEQHETVFGRQTTIDLGSKVAVDAQGNLKKWTRKELEAMGPDLPLGRASPIAPKGANVKHPSFVVDVGESESERDVHLIRGHAYVAMDVGLEKPLWYPVGPLAE